jgi:hypothetical protein
MNAAAAPMPTPNYRAKPHLHEPRLVTSAAHRGSGVLDRIAVLVSAFVGSMWVFVGVTTFIVVWLFVGNIVGFDKTPWPLLLTIINLPQLSVMISLQVSANIAQKTSDSRAVADHETLIALSEMNKRQLELLSSLAKRDDPGPGVAA